MTLRLSWSVPYSPTKPLPFNRQFNYANQTTNLKDTFTLFSAQCLEISFEVLRPLMDREFSDCDGRVVDLLSTTIGFVLVLADFLDFTLETRRVTNPTFF